MRGRAPTRRVRFAPTDTVCVVDAELGPVLSSRPYHRNALAPTCAPPRPRRVPDKRHAARLAHEHAVRCERSRRAESVLLLLHKLRRSRPDLWNATGVASSAEDDVARLFDYLDCDPPERGKLDVDTVESVLLGEA